MDDKLEWEVVTGDRAGERVTGESWTKLAESYALMTTGASQGPEQRKQPQKASYTCYLWLIRC